MADPCGFFADAAQFCPVDVPTDFNATVMDHNQVAFAIKRNAATQSDKVRGWGPWEFDDARATGSRSCNRPQPARQFVAPRQNAGGFPERILHGALASETQQHHGKHHAQAAAGEQTLPKSGIKMGGQCCTLCGRDAKERWARAEDGLQLPLAASERP